MDRTKASLVHASAKLSKLGLTSLHCIISSLTDVKGLRELKRRQQVPQSIYAIIPADLVESLEVKGASWKKSGNHFRVGGVKLYLDASLGARTAALNPPYDDDPKIGRASCRERGWI